MRKLVNPRIGVLAKPGQGTQRDMRDILGTFDQFVYDTVAKKYKPAQRSDLTG